MIVLDTNVVSAVMTGTHEETLGVWLAALDPVTTYLTAVTVVEISFGIAALAGAEGSRDFVKHGPRSKGRGLHASFPSRLETRG